MQIEYTSKEDFEDYVVKLNKTMENSKLVLMQEDMADGYVYQYWWAQFHPDVLVVKYLDNYIVQTAQIPFEELFEEVDESD